MEAPQVVRELKRDSLGRIELCDGPLGPVVRRVADGGRIPGSGLVAGLLLARERRALERLRGLDGVSQLVDAPDYESMPSLDGSVPKRSRVLLRSWLSGVPLWATDELPSDFFERLAELVGSLHARGVCHNDLHKEPNVLVGEDRRPLVIDFQLASVHPREGRLFASRVREDLRHVSKHERHYRTQGGARPDPNAPPRRKRSFVAALWFRTGKPVYNFVTRRLLSTRDGEPRRPKEGPWPRWGPPVG